MIGEIIGIIIFLCLFLLSLPGMFDDRYRDDSWAFFIITLGLLIGFVAIQMYNAESYKIEKIEIVSLDRDIGASGSFILGSGSISTNPVYFAYEYLGNDTYILRQFKSYLNDPIYIIERNNVTPHYEKHIINNCYKDWIFYDCDATQWKQYIYVPKDTIIKEFQG